MLKKIMLLCCLTLSLSACTSTSSFFHLQANHGGHTTGDVMRTVDKIDPLPYFTKILVKGPLEIELIGNQSQRDIRLIGRQDLVYAVKYHVANETLYLDGNVAGKVPQKVLAVIRTGTVLSIDYQGDGHFTAIDLDTSHLTINANANAEMLIKGKHIALRDLVLSNATHVTLKGVNTRELSVVMRDHSQLELSGMINLRRLQAYDHSLAKLYWIDSPYLYVGAHQHAKVKLAGKVAVYEANAFDHAWLHGRYLRVEHSYIKSAQRARVDVLSTKTQQTLARDNSTIFFYDSARSHNGDYMENSGAVLNAVPDR